MATQSSITELASVIAEKTTLLNDYFAAHNLPAPSLDAAAPVSVPIPDDEPTLQRARVDVIEACEQLKARMMGARELLAVNWTANTSLRAILHFKLDKVFPVGETSSYEALAETAGLSYHDVRRLVRHGILNHYLFEEPSPGVVAHSALTKALAEDDLLRDAVQNAVEEFVPASLKLVDAMERWPGSQENNETAFALSNDGRSSMWDIFQAHPDRGARFARGMSYSSNKKDYDSQLLLSNFPWPENGTVVDVGGSHGSVAIEIARRFPQIKCIVQDLPEVVKQGEERFPEDLKERVEFMAHDFFKPQPVVANVYYLRWILHNWSDKYCIRILRNLIPALKTGASIVVHEQVLPADLGQMSISDARKLINMDVGMQMLLGARQRELDEWQELFVRADARFKLRRAHQPLGGKLWIMELVWQG